MPCPYVAIAGLHRSRADAQALWFLRRKRGYETCRNTGQKAEGARLSPKRFKLDTRQAQFYHHTQANLYSPGSLPREDNTMAQVQEQATAVELKFDEHEALQYNEQLYRYDNCATGITHIDDFTDEHVTFYRETGYLVIQQVFEPAEIQEAIAGFVDLVTGKYSEFRGVQFESASKKYVRTLPPEQQLDCVRKLQHFVEFEPRMKAMSDHPNLQRVVRRLLEAEPELFADQALSKPPGIGREKPWHQDHAFFNLPMGTPIVGTWTALDEATLENGCMHVKPGTHKEGPMVHFRRRDWQICDDHLDLNRDVAVPLEPGGVLFFDGLMHHGTPANRSESRRRALQFHFIPAGIERIEQDERMAVFGSEGKDVDC